MITADHKRQEKYNKEAAAVLRDCAAMLEAGKFSALGYSLELETDDICLDFGMLMPVHTSVERVIVRYKRLQR